MSSASWRVESRKSPSYRLTVSRCPKCDIEDLRAQGSGSDDIKAQATDNILRKIVLAQKHVYVGPSSSCGWGPTMGVMNLMIHKTLLSISQLLAKVDILTR